ncbi:hypothetical protein LJR267_010369 [Paraburkholderia hospita]|uniref:hypothetical protein n=1 Tax=Paraburkholderia hospita TaxID=169430 RepID=UPI003ED115C6
MNAMLLLFGYEPPPSDALRDHARALYERRQEGVIVPEVDVGTDVWRPVPQDCHGNFEAWCERNPEYQLVRGWILMPLLGLAYSRFLSHSVVRRPDHVLIDMTPRGPLRKPAPYLFLATILSNDKYEALVTDLYKASEAGFLDHQHPRLNDD